LYTEWTGFGVVIHLLGFDQHLLAVVLVIAGLVSAVIITLALAAFARRRSWSYFFVTLALATLLVRTGFGILTFGGFLDPTSHHILEHGLDILTVLLLLGAVYCARTVDRAEGEIHE
jgi:uncharacterized membrane protein